MRIVVLSHTYPNNINPTADFFVHRQVRALKKANCDVRVIAPIPYVPKLLRFNPKGKRYGSVLKYHSIDSIPIWYPRYFCLPGKYSHSTTNNLMYYGVRGIFSIIFKEFKPQVLHSYTATPDGYAGSLLKRKYGIPAVCTFLGSDINIYPYRDKRTYDLTAKVISEYDQLVVLSGELKRNAEKIAKPKRNIQIIQLGCDLNVFNNDKQFRTKIRSGLGIKPEEKVIIFVGEIIENKGVFELLDAFRELSSRYSYIHLILVGTGPAEDALRKKIEISGLNNKIHIVGWKPHTEIPNWMNAADIFVLASHYEGMPTVVLEAMSCGLPVIATRVGGAPEAVEEGRSGLIVDKKNTKSLLLAISELLEDDNKCNAMGKRGREIVEERFSVDTGAMQLTEIYKEIV